MSEANTIPPFRSVTEEYLSLISGMVNAFAHHRIITDENGIPIDYVFLEVNEAFERMTGLSREEVLGKRVTEVLPGIDEEDFNWIKEYGKVALTGKRQTFEQYSEVLNRWYSVAAFSPLRGEFVTVFNEITDYVKNKQRLKDELQRLERRELHKHLSIESQLLKTIFDSTADGILVVEMDREILYYNRRFLDLWRIPYEVAENADLHQLVEYVQDDVENPDQFTERMIDLMDTFRIEYDLLRFKDGRIFKRTSHPLTDNVERLGRVWSFTDVTPLARARERADLYLDLMTHDIRNALQGISVGIDLLRMDDLQLEKMKGPLNQMERGLNEATRLIAKVDVMRGMENKPLKEKSLTRAVNQCVEKIKKQHEEVDLEIEVPESDMSIMADFYLELAIMNLLENAIDHNPREPKKLYVEIKELPSGCEFVVADNGPGIDQGQRDDIFDTAGRFAGVGLHIVSQIVAKYGGRIEVGDRVEGFPTLGTEFKIWFPSYRAQSQDGFETS